MPRKTTPLAERFEQFLPEILDENLCWEWQGSRIKTGYGKILGGPPYHKTLLAHRIAWELHNAAPIPERMLVCHSCDNPCCVNPFHLFLGDHKVNAEDMISKRRNRPTRGELSGSSKLTASQIEQIRLAGQAGVSQKEIAASYGVCRQTISSVLTGKNWHHLPVLPRASHPRPKGESHHEAKLTEPDIVEIREAARKGETRKSIATRYGVTPENISCIILRKTWRHVP